MTPPEITRDRIWCTIVVVMISLQTKLSVDDELFSGSDVLIPTQTSKRLGPQTSSNCRAAFQALAPSFPSAGNGIEWTNRWGEKKHMLLTNQHMRKTIYPWCIRYMRSIYEAFHKWGVPPVFILCNAIFHYKPSMFGYTPMILLPGGPRHSAQGCVESDDLRAD